MILSGSATLVAVYKNIRQGLIHAVKNPSKFTFISYPETVTDTTRCCTLRHAKNTPSQPSVKAGKETQYQSLCQSNIPNTLLARETNKSIMKIYIMYHMKNYQVDP